MERRARARGVRREALERHRRNLKAAGVREFESRTEVVRAGQAKLKTEGRAKSIHPKGIWKGSESGCDDPILLRGCRTASMEAPGRKKSSRTWRREAGSVIKCFCARTPWARNSGAGTRRCRRAGLGRTCAVAGCVWEEAHAILVGEAHEKRGWGRKSGVAERGVTGGWRFKRRGRRNEHEVRPSWRGWGDRPSTCTGTVQVPVEVL